MRRPLLLPLVPLYAAALALRQWRLERGWEKTRVLWYPVISVGNLSTGGSGKTPLVIALAQLLQAEGSAVDVLSRGYGRKSGEAARVSHDGTAEEFGDEPLLIARKTGVPVWVGAERYQAGGLADQDFIKRGGAMSGDPAPLVHLLDDGFQHRQLHRAVDVVLINSEDLRDTLLPAGNLREPLTAFNRASVLAIPADDQQLERYLTDPVAVDRNSKEPRWLGPIWRVRRRMKVPPVDGPIVAFCGIARPEQFFAGLESRGLRIAAKKPFPDHHRYTQSDVNGLLVGARKVNAGALITTEKDYVRLGALTAAFGDRLKTAELAIEFDDEQSVVAWLKKRLAETHMAQGHRNALEKSTAAP